MKHSKGWSYTFVRERFLKELFFNVLSYLIKMKMKHKYYIIKHVHLLLDHLHLCLTNVRMSDLRPYCRTFVFLAN